MDSDPSQLQTPVVTEPEPEAKAVARTESELELSALHTQAPTEPAASASGETSTNTEPEIVPDGRRRPWLFALVGVVTVASLFGPISASGIWDPHELTTADLSRRIALNLLGARSLELEGAVNTVPTLADLARGQLPFTSIAIGFRVFGLHEWAGRLVLAVWGLFGIIAVYAFVARLSDRFSGALTALVLATMPLYFLHSRTLLGDIVTMAAIALAMAGLGLACFDRSREGEVPGARRRRRILWLFVGILGLAAGFGARGALIGISVPALGVGSAWLVSRSSQRSDGLGNVSGGVALLLGLSALLIGVRALLRASDFNREFSMILGASLDKNRQAATYDWVVHYLGHGLFPWSALIPFAIGRMLAAPPKASREEVERQLGLRLTLLAVSVVGFGIYGMLAPLTGHLPFGPVCALGAVVALALRDFERGAPGSRAMGMAVAAFIILLYYDFKNFPEKGLSAFAVNEPRFPESFKELATKIIKYGALLTSGVFFFSFMERQVPRNRRFDREEYLAWPRLMRTLWGGNLMFGLLVAEVALAALALVTFLSDRQLHLKSFDTMGAMLRPVVQWGFIALPLAVVVAPLVTLFARDVFRSFYARLPLSRALGATLAVAAFGAVMSFGYYPALAAQISPKQVFDAYKKLAKSGEPLGMMGVSAGSASYYAGRNVPTFSNAGSGFNWLVEGNDRRWLVIRADDLPQMNSMYRNRVTPPRNIPVLDARSSEILLVSSAIAEHEANRNPFNDWIRTDPPRPSRRVSGNFGDQLEALGWDVTTPDDKVVDRVVPGKPYKFILYYKVIAQISGSWETFIHIDGFQRRFNGDHKTLDGKYPLHLWRVGDYIADIYTFTLEPNFTPGNYNVFYGLFMGNRRLEVKRGRHQEDRLEAGTIRVE